MSLLDDFDPLASPKPTAAPPTAHANQTRMQSMPASQHQQPRTRPSTTHPAQPNQFNGSLDIAANKLQQQRAHRQSPRNQQPAQKPETSDEDESESDDSDASDESDSVDNQSDDDTRHTTTQRTVTKTTSKKAFTEYEADDKCSVTGCIQKRLPATRTCPIHSSKPMKPTGNKAPDQWSVQYTKSNTSLGLNKNVCYWHVVDKGQEFDVELFHSTLGGKRVIKINGQSKVNEKKVNDNGSRYNFGVGRDRRTSLSVEIRPAGLVGHQYELYVNGRPYDEAKKFWLFNEHA